MNTDNFNVQVKVTPKAQEFQQDLQKVADKIIVNVNVKMSGQQGVKDLNKDLKDLDKNSKKATDSAKNLGNSLNQVDKSSKSLGQSFGDIVTKVGKFYLATKPIQMMQQVFDEAIETVKEFDDAMTDLRKVSDLDGEALTDYTIKLGELGEAVYRSRTEMTEAAVLFKQTGASDEDAAKLAQLANLYMNVADNEMTAADASAYITSQMKAFKITANDAITILDKTNEVSNQFAVSSSDISRALTTSSSSLAVYGNDINETMALVTAGAEIMTGKSQQVGRGLRSIGANISALASSAGELKFQVNGATETISLIDEETGDMVNTFQALSEIHKYWDKMTASEKAALATTLAGKTQLDVFSSVLSNFNTAIEANTVAVESNGSAWEENNKRADSISAKLNLLKSQFQELVLGKGGLQEFAKNLLDVGIAILKFANSDVGQAIIKIASLTAGIALLNKTWTSLQTISKTNILASAITSLIAGETTLGQVTGVLTTKFLANAAAWAATPFGMVTIAVGAIVAIKAAYDHFNVTLEEHVEKLKELKSESDSAKTEIDSLQQSLDGIKDKISQINPLEITSREELSLLLEEEASLERQLRLAKAKAEITQKELEDEANKTLSSTQYSGLSGYYGELPSGRSIGTEKVAPKQDLIDTYSAYQQITQSIKDLEQQQLQYVNSKGDIIDSEYENYNALQAEIDSYKQTRDSIESYGMTLVDTLNTTANAFDGNTQQEQAMKDGIYALTDAFVTLVNGANEAKNTTEGLSNGVVSVEDAAENLNEDLGNSEDYLKELAKQSGISEEELTSLAESLNTSVESIAEWLSGANDFKDSLSEISSGYQTLKEAAEEYNATGTYSAETMSQLLALHPDYISALQVENGQLVVNEAALQNVANAMIDDAEATLLTKTQTEIANIIAGNFDATLVSLGTDALTTATNVETAGIKAAESGVNANEGALGWIQFWNAASKGQGTVTTEEQAKAMEQLRHETKREYEALEDLRGKVGQYGKASASAHSKAAKATDKEKSATDSLKDKYKTVIDFIVKQYDKQIDKIKEAKDAAIKSVESQIKSLEKEKDSKVKAIDAEITALQRERDAREKYWQDQLDKLEKENDERERNIALQEKQQALALAQQTNVMVLKDGQFQYTQDETAVAGAEQDLAEQKDQNEYERQKELIEELRDTELEWYDERIQSLEDYKEQVEEYYEEQIEQLEEYKEYLEEYYEGQIEALEAEKEAVNATLEEGAANQQEYWNKMKEQLQAFVEEWNALVGEMKFPNISGSGISLSSVGGKISASMGGKSTGDNKVSAYASGKGSIGDSEIAVVGENPKYRELVIGSKLNNDQGAVMSLKRGSGVVNAGATNTLASLFNSLNGQKSVGQPVNNSSQSMSIQIGSISLPEVKDGQGFVDYLQNFSADITQQSFRRA
nr:MAG TPA: minor tail protein [Bacteriophage sp.]